MTEGLPQGFLTTKNLKKPSSLLQHSNVINKGFVASEPARRQSIKSYPEQQADNESAAAASYGASSAGEKESDDECFITRPPLKPKSANLLFESSKKQPRNSETQFNNTKEDAIATANVGAYCKDSQHSLLDQNFYTIQELRRKELSGGSVVNCGQYEYDREYNVTSNDFQSTEVDRVSIFDLSIIPPVELDDKESIKQPVSTAYSYIPFIKRNPPIEKPNFIRSFLKKQIEWIFYGRDFKDYPYLIKLMESKIQGILLGSLCGLPFTILYCVFLLIKSFYHLISICFSWKSRFRLKDSDSNKKILQPTAAATECDSNKHNNKSNCIKPWGRNDERTDELTTQQFPAIFAWHPTHAGSFAFASLKSRSVLLKLKKENNNKDVRVAAAISETNGVLCLAVSKSSNPYRIAVGTKKGLEVWAYRRHWEGNYDLKETFPQQLDSNVSDGYFEKELIDLSHDNWDVKAPISAIEWVFQRDCCICVAFLDGRVLILNDEFRLTESSVVWCVMNCLDLRLSRTRFSKRSSPSTLPRSAWRRHSNRILSEAASACCVSFIKTSCILPFVVAMMSIGCGNFIIVNLATWEVNKFNFPLENQENLINKIDTFPVFSDSSTSFIFGSTERLWEFEFPMNPRKRRKNLTDKLELNPIELSVSQSNLNHNNKRLNKIKDFSVVSESTTASIAVLVESHPSIFVFNLLYNAAGERISNFKCSIRIAGLSDGPVDLLSLHFSPAITKSYNSSFYHETQENNQIANYKEATGVSVKFCQELKQKVEQQFQQLETIPSTSSSSSSSSSSSLPLLSMVKHQSLPMRVSSVVAVNFSTLQEDSIKQEIKVLRLRF